MALQKPPPLKPIAPLATAKPPPVSRTQDNYTHHTSPVHGPQPEPPTELPVGAPGASSRRCRMCRCSHQASQSGGRPRDFNDG
jgi:hypothetical protein